MDQISHSNGDQAPDTRPRRFRWIRNLFNSSPEKDSGVRSGGVGEERDSGEVGRERRDYQDSRESDKSQTRRTEHVPFSSDRLPSGYSYNPITRTIEQPFSLVPEDVRLRVERFTGRSLEASYEGLMRLIVDAVEHDSDFDWSKPARSRRRRY